MIRLNDQKVLYNIPCRTEYLSRSFFPSTIKDWNSGELVSLRRIVSKSIFKNKLLRKIRPKKKPIFGLSDHNKVRHIFMLRMELSPLHSHKAAYGFIGVHNACVVCGVEENTEHYLLTCMSYRLFYKKLENRP